MVRWHHRHRRLVEGVLLGVGAPVGWAVLCSVLDLWPLAERAYNIWLFCYMTMGTAAAFGVFSYIIGCSEERFEQQSIRDPLTNLYNRRFFQERFDQEFAHAARGNGPVTIVLVDLDHFKQVNDTYGHQVGDIVLKTAAKRMQKLVRRDDVVARVGGEEFAVLMPGSDAEGGRVLAERIRKVIRNVPITLPSGATLHVKATLGVAGTDKVDVEKTTQLFSAADTALYQGKAGGRDCVVVQSEAGASHCQTDPQSA